MTKTEVRKALEALDQLTDAADGALLEPLGFVRSALLELWQRSQCRAADGSGLMSHLRQLQTHMPQAVAMSCLAQAVYCLCIPADDMRLCADEIRLLKAWQLEIHFDEEETRCIADRLRLLEETSEYRAASRRARTAQSTLIRRRELARQFARYQRQCRYSALKRASDEADANACFLREKLFEFSDG